jgi:hypothetical protein
VAGPIQSHGDQFLVSFLVTLYMGVKIFLPLQENLQEDRLNFVGCLVLFVTSLPSVTTETAKVAGLAISLFLLGLGNGGVKAVVSPFIGDQYTVMTPQLVVRKGGERIIVDRTLTMQYIYNVFYW